ncbi:MAG: sulfotransferase [Paracoccaceae bacterium]|nr:sulfotransferase [Paracoccaceae bacterium]
MRDRLLHPLGSGSLVNLVRLVAAYGCDLRFAPWLVPIGLTSMLRQPLDWLETARHGAAIARQQIDPPPIFILGHWRSGTTHLQNVMSADPQFARVTLAHAAMPREFLSMPSGMTEGLGRMLPQTRLMDDVPVAPDVP